MCPAPKFAVRLLEPRPVQVLPDLLWLASSGQLVSDGPSSAQPKLLVNTTQPFIKDTLELLGILPEQVRTAALRSPV